MLSVLTLYHFLSAALDGPGYVPLGWRPEKKEDERCLQWCEVCHVCVPCIVENQVVLLQSYREENEGNVAGLQRVQGSALAPLPQVRPLRQEDGPPLPLDQQLRRTRQPRYEADNFLTQF